MQVEPPKNVSPYSTLNPDLNACPDEDALKLFKAYKGMGCDKFTVADILTHRTWFQRYKIVEQYTKINKEDLIKRTKCELCLPYERLIVLLLYTGHDMDAYIMYKATKGLGTDESALRFVLCSKASFDINSIKERYFCLFEKSLTEEIKGDTSGPFRDILVYLCDNKRETCQTIDKNKISNDIDLLSEVSCLKTDQIIEIFCKNSFDYIQCLCRMYEHKTEKNLGTFLSEHFSTDFGKTIQDICQFSIDPIKFYSGKLKEGIDCKDVYKIIRVIVTRCEIDLKLVLKDYECTFDHNLMIDMSLIISKAYPDVNIAVMMLLGLK